MLDYSQPARFAEAITPDTPFDETKGIYVGVGGNVTAQMAGSSPVTFVGVLAGSILPIAVTNIVAATTTATNLIALR